MVKPIVLYDLHKKDKFLNAIMLQPAISESLFKIDRLNTCISYVQTLLRLLIVCLSYVVETFDPIWWPKIEQIEYLHNS